MRLNELAVRWRTRADDLQRFAPAAAEAFRECAEQLGTALESAEDSVTLTEASTIGGYSVDYLQRLVRAATIANVGKKYRPRIRRSDVPVKPGHVLQSSTELANHVDRRRIVADALTSPTRT